MKSTLKTILLITMIFVIAFAFIGCQDTTSNTNENEKTEETTKEPTKEPVTISYWVPFRTANAKIMETFAEAEAWVEWQNATGITIECIHPTIGQEIEAYQLMIVSGDWPDVIELNNIGKDLYIGGSQQAIDDEIYIKLNDVIASSAPNFQSLLDSDPEIAKAVKTDAGDIWAFQMLELVQQPSYMGPAVRQDWLDDLGLDTPTTIDDWYDMLLAFKNEKGAVSPYLLDSNGIAADGNLIGAFGAYKGFLRNNGVVSYGLLNPGFKAYVTVMNKWYSEGLVDSEFVSFDGNGGANTFKKIAQNETGALTTGFWMLDSYLAAAEDPNFNMVGVPYPSLNEGDIVSIRQYNELVRNASPTVITTACEYPEEAARLIDYGYGPEGFLLMNYGIEGVGYNLIDETPKYKSLSDKTAVPTDYILNNPDFPSVNDMFVIAARHSGPFIRDELNRSYFTVSETGLKAQNEAWFGDNSIMLPKMMSLTADEGTEFNTTMTDINTYIDEMLPKFIMGTESLDNFDDFIGRIESMGIEDLVSIQQAALDRFNAR